MRGEWYGSGPRRYLGLHGWNGTRETFLPLVKGLPQFASFRSVDLPGCGKSAPPARWDLDTIVREIACELDRPTTLIGNCSGAVLALLVARKVPSRVERVVMIDAFASWPWYFRIFLSPAIGRYAYFTTFANPAGRWLTNVSLRSKRAGSTNLTRGFERANHESTYRYLTMLGGAGSAEDFADITVPVDVLYGARSFAAVRESAYAWARILPHARIFELQEAGHLPIVEAAPQVREILFGGNACSTEPTAHLQNSAQ